MIEYSPLDIEKSLEGNCIIKGQTQSVFFSNAKPISEAKPDSLVWISASRTDKAELINSTLARIIICDYSIINVEIPETKCLVFVENPRLSFLRIVDRLLSKKPAFGIHPSAVIHPEAKLSGNIFIGPFSYIGRSTIGEGSFIFGHCHIYDEVTIGKNVIIHAGTVIGSDGFGYEKNENSEFEKFPHIGGVFIEDDVEIGANTCIDRGALGNTLIRQGAKIDNLVHIAHNVVVGKNAVVIANAMIGGSTKIGDNSWIAPSATLRDTLQIGSSVTVGLGATVTKNIPDNETWTGNPARPLSEFLDIQKKIKRL